MPKIVATKEDWIRKGVAYFVEGGVEALSIERMARELGCSKSSFYWYFGNRDEFIESIVYDWAVRTTEDVISQSLTREPIDDQIKQALRRLFADAGDDDFRLHLRKLGLQVPPYATLLSALEAKQMDFLRSLLQERGESSAAARRKSSIIYHFYLGWHERNKFNADAGHGAEDPVETILLTVVGLREPIHRA
ncbi:TetR/AcrR family transcriptional regulator [Cohnella nanjingensis]|uniref:TetR/AcrR family transcriptional regulator n=1 Tax=Cohnella nanjingensis TaxID=1387779 RepID=A0A7X0RTV1_9BACL|nr:TetR/AcrR family transcriptional regulator [Cohnella nanjingensis]MBB6673608.1 TetR/AcrR family transcriptional regulator [Cohnella nanjingensis]